MLGNARTAIVPYPPANRLIILSIVVHVCTVFRSVVTDYLTSVHSDTFDIILCVFVVHEHIVISAMTTFFYLSYEVSDNTSVAWNMLMV